MRVSERERERIIEYDIHRKSRRIFTTIEVPVLGS